MVGFSNRMGALCGADVRPSIECMLYPLGSCAKQIPQSPNHLNISEGFSNGKVLHFSKNTPSNSILYLLFLPFMFSDNLLLLLPFMFSDNFHHSWRNCTFWNSLKPVVLGFFPDSSNHRHTLCYEKQCSIWFLFLMAWNSKFKHLNSCHEKWKGGHRPKFNSLQIILWKLWHRDFDCKLSFQTVHFGFLVWPTEN